MSFSTDQGRCLANFLLLYFYFDVTLSLAVRLGFAIVCVCIWSIISLDEWVLVHSYETILPYPSTLVERLLIDWEHNSRCDSFDDIGVMVGARKLRTRKQSIFFFLPFFLSSIFRLRRMAVCWMESVTIFGVPPRQLVSHEAQDRLRFTFSCSYVSYLTQDRLRSITIINSVFLRLRIVLYCCTSTNEHEYIYSSRPTAAV